MDSNISSRCRELTALYFPDRSPGRNAPDPIVCHSAHLADVCRAVERLHPNIQIFVTENVQRETFRSRSGHVSSRIAGEIMFYLTERAMIVYPLDMSKLGPSPLDISEWLTASEAQEAQEALAQMKGGRQ